MIAITFKNVGQGDSIILEWTKAGSRKIGVIDCKKGENGNPTLEYIISEGYNEIEFLLLTHPHLDHSSGFVDLIQYCLDNEIRIGHFLHTSGPDSNKYWKSSFDTASGNEYAFALYALLHKAYCDGKIVINNVEGESINPHVNLAENLYLYIMAPTHKEFYKWFNNEHPAYDEEELGNKPSVNFLSTVVKIYSKDWYALLTADVDKSVLIYYDLHKPEELTGRLVLAQSPHHGAGRNHNNTFWRNRLLAGQKTAIVFSVGKNSYNHPAKSAVDFFIENGFDLYSTNQVGALASVTDKAKESSDALDPHGTVVLTKKDRFNGDKVFKIDTSGSIMVS